MDQVESYQEIDTGKAWTKVRQRLHEDGLLDRDAEKSKIPARLQISGPLAYAATVILLIAVGSIGYYLSRPASSVLMTLETGADNSTFVQTFDDGSIVYMAGNTSLSYPEIFSKGQRRVTFSGEAFFDIHHKVDQPFVIETKQAVIEVLGTAFNLRSFENDFELIVEEGRVKITPKDLPAGSEIVSQWEMVTGLENGIKKFPVIDRTYLSWRMNKMQFRDESLDNIALVISKNYNVDIDFENDGLRERRLSVTFHNNEINTIAEVIAFSLDLDYEFYPGTGVYFKEKR